MTPDEKHRVFNSGDFKSLSDGQRRIFRQVVEDLDSRGLFKPTDVPIIASYSRNVLLARLASRELEKNGLLLTEVDKYHGKRTKQNPAVDILQKAQISMEKTAALLGLTPTGRKRMKGEGAPEKSELDVFMEKITDGD